MFRKIAFIVGTRPEAIKLLPVYQEFKRPGEFDAVLISTGQHREMLEQIFRFFEVAPDIELNVMTPNQSLAGLSARLMEKLDGVLHEHRFEAIVVQGDTTTCMIGSLVAFYHKAKVIHVEAGLRTYNKYSPFPEEINRKITGVIADIHFAPTQRAADALYKEGINEHVVIAGNTVIDSLLYAVEKVKASKDIYLSLLGTHVDFSKKIVLVTGHRRESFGEGFKNICNALQQLAEGYPDLQFIYPVHLNPNVREIVYAELGAISNVKLIDPLPYDQLVFLMNECYMILTDSGGIQEEAPTLGKPVIVLRDTTERPEGIELGCSVLAGTETKTIVEKFVEICGNSELYTKMSSAGNPYGDGNASKLIHTYCKKVISER